MPKRKSLSIPQTFLLYVVVFFAISAITTSSLYLYFEYRAFEKQSKESKQSYIEAQKQLVQQEVDKVIEHIAVSRNIRINQINELLTYRVDQAYLLAENLYNKNKNKYSKKVILEIIREAMRPLRSKEIHEDYFIIKTNGEEVLYPAHPEIEGVNFLNLKDSPEKAIVQEEIRIALKYGQGFIREKLTSFTTDKSFTLPSVIYVRLFKPLNIIIGTGEYIPDIEEDIKKKSIKYIKKIHYGVNQRIFINDTKGNVIISNSTLYREGDNILELKDAKGFEIIKAEIKASKKTVGGFTTFEWLNDDSGRINKNLSFVKTYPEWNWVIGAWFDLTLIENEINSRILGMQKAQIKKATSILIIIILSHLVLLIIFKYVANKTKKNTTTFIHLLKKAIHSNSDIDKSKLNYTEFHKIADSTNEIIAKKRKADEDLRNSELQFKSLFEIAPIMILGLDEINNIILWNKECEKFTGYSIEEINALDNPFKEIINSEDEYAFFETQITNPSGQFHEYTLINKAKDLKNQFWAGFSSPPNLRIGVGYDTTELKKTLTKLNITAEKLKEANHTKDKFLSIIAHDLKNPFNAIIGFSSLLCSNFNDIDDETKLDLIEDIQHSATLNFNLLEKLLEWAMSQSDQIPFRPEVLNLKEIITDSISFASYQAIQKNIEIQSSIDSNMRLYADYNMLTSIIRNLISNAIKFTPENGEILIKAEENNNDIRISIKDNGVGMSPNDVARLFRTDTKVQTSGTQDEKGTGLGLLICKEFVDKHQGEIWVESQLDEGCEFFIRFPKQEVI